ncbi:type III PLP-dependent enzyme [Arenibaculum pallidiluteum]|uniref:type III PLP-dependent enzyme n=1 Tax=Arenibaculum pallidiluteum TaxID=2812559 RepID=UPI001A958FE0|nr:type III PLP-dependent enzyme [Arenibaculum pallidiluteum]
MGHVRFRSAVAPLRRGPFPVPAARPGRASRAVAEIVRDLRPTDPLHCIRPSVLTETAGRFVEAFPGTVLYAVKCNPEPAVLRALHAGGVRHFDCASPAEVRLVRQLFADAEIHYMHPVKAPTAIREAWSRHGVRDFSLDSAEEIEKILAETDGARDLGLFVRLALPKGGAVYDLSGKFGAQPDEAARLLRRARAAAARVGICFHVGSQCLDPLSYDRAIRLAAEVSRDAGVELDVLDVGGGFPVSYPDVTPPPLNDFVAAIGAAFSAAGFGPSTSLWCEPGRALVAPGVSVVVQVLKRRGQELFVNDGVYGSLSDAGVPGFRFPARLIRAEEGAPAPDSAFAFYGPTCDSADFMKGPFMLPDDVGPGDWIEIGQLGAYGGCLRTAFNGFDQARLVEVEDVPLLATPGYSSNARRVA